MQRFAALEHRVERLANAISSGTQTSAMRENYVSEEQLTLFENRIVSGVERRLARAPSPTVPQPDPALIAAEVGQQIQALIKEAASQSDPLPLMADSPIDRSRDLNPLVMGATERAIVRLTHRLEKLEEWHHRSSGEVRSKGGLMGRLFES